MEFDRELLEILACPSCHGGLKFDAAASELTCRACRLAYPVKEGIADLLPESARTLAGSDNDEA
jgi:uncharacterized protein